MQPTPDGVYYCRAKDASGRKVTAVAAGDVLESTLNALAARTSDWLIQRLYDFPIGGAAYVDTDLTYIEMAYGSTIGLLRHGELCLAVDLNDHVPTPHPSHQQHQWRYRNLSLVREAAPRRQADETGTALALQVARLISDSGLEGLFEWGHLNSEVFFLDLKPLADTGGLGQFLATNRHPQPCPITSDQMELPVLGALDESNGMQPICIARGARLSHAITYRYASNDGTRSIVFKSW